MNCYVFEVLITFVVCVLLSAMILPKISLVAFRRKLFDRPDERKVHSAHIPRLGGVAFFPCIAVTVSLVIVCHNLFMDSRLFSMELAIRLLTLFSTLFIIYLMGIMDDLIGIRYRSKFGIQILCALLLVLSGLYLDNLYGLFGIHELPCYVGMPLTVFVIVFILNAINLIDGIDGLAAMLSIMAFFIFGCMSIVLEWWIYAFLSFGACGVLYPFFFYNVFGQYFHGRKIFMGDTGSLTIGLLLAALAIRFSMYDSVKESIYPCSIVPAFSFLMVPMLDVVRVVLHRLRTHKPLFAPDKNHIHHKFLALGIHQHWAMVWILGIAVFCAVLNMWLVYYISVTALFIIDVAAWTALNCYITAKIQKKVRASNLKKVRNHN